MEFWFSEQQTPNVKLSIRVDRQLYSGRSEFQRIDVFDSPEFGRFLTLDGYMMLTEKDEFIYHEMITHVPMAVHPHVRKALVIGAGDGLDRPCQGAVVPVPRLPAEVAQHPVRHPQAAGPGARGGDLREGSHLRGDRGDDRHRVGAGELGLLQQL